MISHPQTQQKHIGNLCPSDKNITLTFQICDIIEQTPEGVYCRVVDEHGIADAFFEKYANKLKLGDVYTMKDLRVKIVDGHIQIRMNKQVTIQRVPITIAFKDKVNDVSKKTFASKKQVQNLNKPQREVPIQKEPTQKQQSTKNKQQNGKEDQHTFKQPWKEDMHSQKTNTNTKSTYRTKEKDSTHPYDQRNKRDCNQPKQQKIESSKNLSPTREREQKKQQRNKYEQSSKNLSPTREREQKKQQRNKYEQKKQQKNRYEQKDTKKHGQTSNNGEVKLKEVTKRIGDHVNICVWVVQSKKTMLEDGNWRVLVADDSGSMWAEFNQGTVLQGDSWCELDNMKVHQSKGGQIIIKETDMYESSANLKTAGKTYNLTPVTH